MIKYRTGGYDKKIEAVEIVKETAKQVTFKTERGGERREAKRSEWQNWHDSFEKAKQFLLTRTEKSIQCLQQRVEDYKVELEKIRALTQEDTQ